MIAKSFDWSFTITCITADDLSLVESLESKIPEISYVLYSLERQVNRELCIQGYLSFSEPMSFFAVKNLFNGKTVVEKTKDVPGMIQYLKRDGVFGELRYETDEE